MRGSFTFTRLLFTVSPMLGMSVIAQAASYNFNKIADASGPFSAFNNAIPDSGLPSINAGGVVAFWASLDAGGSGIYTGDGTLLGTVATTGGTYSDFNRGLPVINNFGDVAFRASRTAGGIGIYRSGTAIATSENGFSELNDSPAISPTTGLVALRGSRVIVFPFSTPGFWAGSGGGVPAEIATGTSGISIDGPSVNSLGQIAWVGTYGPTGVHVASGGSVTNWVSTTGMFSGFDPVCAINSPSVVSMPTKVAFLANLDAGGSGIYTVHVGESGFVITPIATNVSIGVFSRPSINGSGKLVFRRVTSGGADALYTGADLTVDRVVGDGDVLDGLTVTDARSSKQALNDTGRIAFRATLSDGSTAIYRAVPCAADVNGNHTVDIDDLLAVISGWGAASGAADVTRNGIVNIDDLLAVISAWGLCPAS